MMTNVFEKTYKILSTCTPLPVDCGQLCDGACCKGEEDAGMLLFPGEETLFLNREGFEIIETEYVLASGFVVKLLLCHAACNREERPLACRIFPLLGFTTEENKIEVRVDPRAVQVCPLAYVGLEEGVTTEFIQKVQKVFEILMKDPLCEEFIKTMTAQLDFGGEERGG